MPPAGKRDAALSGALAVFARDGYSRASIDAIAAEAGVSTRTLYNHFGDKENLFVQVILASTTAMSEARIALMERHLFRVTNLEADLVAFVEDWVAPRPEFDGHFALVRQVNAETGHIGPEALQAWRKAGPLRVLDELGRRLSALPSEHGLRIDSGRRAAMHLLLLTVSAVETQAGLRAKPLTKRETHDILTDGLGVFLRAYRA